MNMKKYLTFLLALLGLNTACSQQNYENASVSDFAALITQPDVVLLDVRTDKEFAEGHIGGALHADVNKDDFIEQARQLVPQGKRVAVYCRSGRRSANAANQLAKAGYTVVNLKGGIMEWQKQQMPVTTETAGQDVFKTKSGKTVAIYPLLHASIRIVFDGKEIEIDPVGKLGNRTTDYAALPKADYIFVTHEHGDHFDRAAIGQLTAAGTRLVTNRRCADMLGYGEVMANGDHKEVADNISVEAVPAYNITEGHLQFHPKGRDNGYILTIDGLRIYIAGDTEDIPEMANIKDIDVAFLPCNQPYTMTTSQFVNAARAIKPRVLFPYHYGQTDISQLPQQLKADDIDVRMRPFD